MPTARTLTRRWMVITEALVVWKVGSRDRCLGGRLYDSVSWMEWNEPRTLRDITKDVKVWRWRTTLEITKGGCCWSKAVVIDNEWMKVVRMYIEGWHPSRRFGMISTSAFSWLRGWGYIHNVVARALTSTVWFGYSMNMLLLSILVLRL